MGHSSAEFCLNKPAVFGLSFESLTEMCQDGRLLRWEAMYVCMHVCMYACMYACMYVCMYTKVLEKPSPYVLPEGDTVFFS
jgi:hypothetical protein